MNRRVIWAIVVLGSLTLSIELASSLLDRNARRAVSENGSEKDFHQVTAEELDRDVRNHVPLGSSRPFVEGFLTGAGMRFSFDPSTQTIRANAPYLKGSGFVVYASLGFTFQFDDALKLKSIASKVYRTGP
ncbi:MAG: hypothetical protein ACLPZY_11700 [Terracidiphilus sp.]